MPTERSSDAKRAPTLADVAALSGVAQSTVSRALSNPGRVNAATRERIEFAAERLGYVRAAAARPPDRRSTDTIAVLVTDVTNPFYFDIIKGTLQQLTAAGYRQVLVDTEESAEVEDSTLRLLGHSFDGAILAASRLTDRRLKELSADLPIVAINRPMTGVSSVVIDTPSGVDQAIEHLISLGHSHIVYVGGPENSWANQRRWRAMERAMARHDLTPRRVGPFSSRRTSGAAAADAVINSGATACIAFNDLLAIGMLRRFADRGIGIPDDLSIVGCDDIFGADFCHPPLTTLTAPIVRAGRVAVSMLLSRIGSTPQPVQRQSVVLPTHLTVRESTGPARAKARR